MVPLGVEAHRTVSTLPFAVITQQTGIRAGKLHGFAEGGPTKMVRRTTRDRLLGVKAWTNIGVQRRLRALARLGWSMRALAPEVGVSQDALKRIRNADDRDFIRQNVAALIVDAYERLCMTVPEGRGATRARNAAETEGWLPPLAWESIDDPDEQPRDWHYIPTDRADAIRDLAEMGHGVTEVCRRLRIGREALEKWAARNGMSETFRLLVARETAVFEHRNQHTREVAS